MWFDGWEAQEEHSDFIGFYRGILSKSTLVVFRSVKCLVCIIVALAYVRCLASAIEKAMKV